MKSILKFLGIVVVMIIIIALTNLNFITPVGAEIMIVALFLFAAWYLSLVFGKGKDA